MLEVEVEVKTSDKVSGDEVQVPPGLVAHQFYNRKRDIDLTA